MPVPMILPSHSFSLDSLPTKHNYSCQINTSQKKPLIASRGRGFQSKMKRERVSLREQRRGWSRWKGQEEKEHN